MRAWMISAMCAALAVGGACINRKPPVPTGANAAAASVPPGALAALAKKYPGWQLASPPSDAACRVQAPQGSPSVVTGDFNGDDMPDFGLQVTTTDGPRIVVALARLDAYVLAEPITPAGGAAGVIAVRARGQRYMAPGQSFDNFFAEPTMVLSQCDGTATAYLWNGRGFDPQTITR